MKMVDIVYFYGEQYVVKVPLFVAMISALLFGLILAWFLTIKEKMALKKEIKKLNRDLKAKEAEIKRIRNLPLLEESDIETQEVKK
jgi:Mg2+/citrate symporter